MGVRKGIHGQETLILIEEEDSKLNGLGGNNGMGLFMNYYNG